MTIWRSAAERGEEPERPYSGTFTVRIPPELHRDAALQARLKDKSLNSWVAELLAEAAAGRHVKRRRWRAQGTRRHGSHRRRVRAQPDRETSVSSKQESAAGARAASRPAGREAHPLLSPTRSRRSTGSTRPRARPSAWPGRRPASYWFKTQRIGGPSRLALLAEEQREDLPLVNALRADVKRWRASGYEGATQVTKELLRYWWRADRPRRLFFCQLEAAETVIFLNEIRLAGRRPRFTPQFTDEHLDRLRDLPADPSLLPLTRLGLKMATGSGKTVVMAMLMAWAFCNRGQVSSDERFPAAALIVCPNLTIKERLQVLRPENPNNYFAEFDLVPAAMRPLLHRGKVLVTNWHLFAPESEHVEGGRSYTVVNKGPESPDAFARRVLGDLYDHAPILVMNDEGHHAWRPKPAETLDARRQAA